VPIVGHFKRLVYDVPSQFPWDSLPTGEPQTVRAEREALFNKGARGRGLPKDGQVSEP